MPLRKVIDILRQHYPGTWAYTGWGTWEGPFVVYARPNPKSDTPDATPEILQTGRGVRRFEYVREGTQEPIPELNGNGQAT